MSSSSGASTFPRTDQFSSSWTQSSDQQGPVAFDVSFDHSFDYGSRLASGPGHTTSFQHHNPQYNSCGPLRPGLEAVSFINNPSNTQNSIFINFPEPTPLSKPLRLYNPQIPSLHILLRQVLFGAVVLPPTWTLHWIVSLQIRDNVYLDCLTTKVQAPKAIQLAKQFRALQSYTMALANLLLMERFSSGFEFEPSASSIGYNPSNDDVTTPNGDEGGSNYSSMTPPNGDSSEHPPPFPAGRLQLDPEFRPIVQSPNANDDLGG
ncbi:hypothetical protein DL98DRAFT_596045 [Cadophora sp. DSE1049]|nr:hypothetical protein DL98DRAFT_596045 [Cadophora sp. DSE1049]